MSQHDLSPTPGETEGAVREVRFEYSRDFQPILRHLGCSLLISTYQAGKLVAVGTNEEQVTFSFHNFEQAMGVAVQPRRIAVGTRREIWFLNNAAELAARVEPAGQHDACWLARNAFVTGNIHSHEMAWSDNELWVVNTLFSSLCTLHEDYSFVPRWKPKFITNLAAEDRCHLNGLALADGRPKVVTAMSETDEAGGWRPTKATSGVIIDVDSGETVARGFSMPHSPRLHAGRLWVLDSGKGQLATVDPASGKAEVVDQVPGYTRGLAFHGQFAFVGLSKIRETAVFGGVPIAERRDELKCGVAVVDLQSGTSVAYLQFLSGVDEIFDVQVLPGARCPAVSGPYLTQDGTPEIWVVPREDQVESLVASARASNRPADPGPDSKPGAVRQDPRALDATGRQLHEQGRLQEAIACFQQALQLDPHLAVAHNNLGNALQDAGDRRRAEACYREAVRLQPDLVPARQNLGYVLKEQGHLDESLDHFQRAQQLQPNNVISLIQATALPVVYESLADLRQRREQLEQRVKSLVEGGFTIDTTDTIAPTVFYAAYQGLNDVELQRDIGCILRAPETKLASRPRRDGRVRVGFLSRYYRNHTIGRLNLGLIQRLPRDRFEVTVISPGRHTDPMAEAFRQAADVYAEVATSPAKARGQIAELGLDLLYFSDVGMDPLTYTLCFSRMAPVQCASWGHPVTTGSPAIDYFLSSELLETAEADEHYTERLVRLPALNVYYQKPQLPVTTADRGEFGLAADRHLYLCPQTLFKFHPEFDAILAGILESDPVGQLVLLEGRYSRWTELLRERFQRTLGGHANRITFLPAQSPENFLRLNAVADVVLDPIHFGGGNTSYEAFAVGTPVVTLPSQFLRGRITQALYQKMGITAGVVNNASQYIEVATRLGIDADYRRCVRADIVARNDILWEDATAIEAVAEFCESAPFARN